MKKVFLVAVLALLSQFSFAKIWLVDNNANSPQQLKRVDSAMNVANSGDTIMIEGSSTPYGVMVITKSITVIGEGYNDALGQNTFVDFDVQSSNVYISGIKGSVKFNGNLAPGNSINNITVERCHLITSTTGISFTGIDNGSLQFAYMGHIAFRNNIFESIAFGFWENSFSNMRMQFDTLLIENNIFSLTAFAASTTMTGVETFIIRNNVFINGAIQAGWPTTTLFYWYPTNASIHDAAISNNIFYGSNPQGCSDCIYYNNLTFQNGADDVLPGGSSNGNIIGNPQFISYPGGAVSFNHDYKLNATSPCIDAGTGNTDIGITGGYFPFTVGAGPKIPVVDFINISNSAVPSDSTFHLQFDARTRQ